MRRVQGIGAAYALLASGFLSSQATDALARGAERDLKAAFACRRELSPGRVLCELAVDVTRGRLDWADVLVLEAPVFARPLRSRVGPRQATRSTPSGITLPIAFAATRSGRGQVRVEARAVLCTAARRGACTPITRVLSAELEVGAREER